MSKPLESLLALAAGVALSGCATTLPPNPTWAEVRGQVPAAGLPYIAQVGANALPIALVGFWSDPKEREAFEKRRAEEIEQRMAGDKTQGEHVAGSLGACITVGPLCPVLLPVLIPLAITSGHVHERIRAGHSAPYLRISQKNAQRLTAMFSSSLTGAALGARTLALARSAPAPSAADAEFPRVVVTMKSATMRHDARDDLHMTVVAHAQAQPSPGVTWAPTEHVIDMELWQRYDYTVAVQKILDVMAQSIVATYLPQHPHSVEQRHWEDVRTKDTAQVQGYLERYPNGAFAELARARMAELAAQAAELAAQEAAARKRAAEAAAAERALKAQATDEASAKSFFRDSARVRQDLEGRWVGSVPVPFALCGLTSYALLVKDGYVEGTVERRGPDALSVAVAGFVGEDGAVSVVPVSSGRLDRSQTLYLTARTGRLTGASNILCTQRYIVTLERD